MIEKKNISPEEAVDALADQNRYLGIVIDDINGKFTLIMERFETLDKKIARFQTETRENFQMFFERLSAYDDDKADKKDVVVLERRVTRLEDKSI